MPAERAAVLEGVCAADAELRRRVESLLRAHDDSASLPPVAGDAAAVGSLEFQPGTVVAGRYRLVEAIGEGGMGAVWVAEQTEPVRRRVALKLIKAGMDSKLVLARFEAERQALAMMDHPNIAKVLDGGLTESGRPFFVMEYVKGVPITEYCDAARLSVPGRLQLFIQVCQAVQHAHQKGIIHRDLKPSNILVAPYDDRLVPKVIDFGLAKAVHQSLTEQTLCTPHEAMLGTPLYMSPEQTQLNNLDVDARSDLYSLGVLLYELLTGTTPLEKQRFKEAAWEEIRRIIREEEPPRPSTRLSSSQSLPLLAAGRQTEPARLTKLVCGELDWIVMKALEKDRTRRYETASGLAVDIQRYLDGDPVLAAPPSARYRLRKFVRKHRAALTTAAAVVVLLLAGAAISTWQAVRATRAEAAARAAEHEAETRRADAERQRARAEANARDAREYAAKLQASEAQAKANAKRATDAKVLAEDSARQAKESQRQAEEMARKMLEAQSRETAARVDAMLPTTQFSKVEISYLEEIVRTAEGNFRFVDARLKMGFRATEADLQEAKARLCMAKGRLAWANGDLLQCQKEYDDAVAASKRRVDIVKMQYQYGIVDYTVLAAAEASRKEAELCASKVKRRIAAGEDRRQKP
ncbi:MAG: protein kinase [Thermoguttaceae bacterium]